MSIHFPSSGRVEVDAMTRTEALEFLELTEEATQEEIQSAYQRKAAAGVLMLRSSLKAERTSGKEFVDKAKAAFDVLGHSHLRQSAKEQGFWHHWTDSMGVLLIYLRSMGLSWAALAIGIPVALLFLPAFLIVLPLRSFLLAGRENPTRLAWLSVVASFGILCAAAYSPVAVAKALEGKYKTDALCQICGKPGGAAKYSNAQRSAIRYRIYCKDHASQAPATMDIRQDAQGTETENLASNAQAIALYAAFIFAVATFFAFNIAEGDPTKIAILMTSSVVVMEGVFYYFKQDWFRTLLGS